MSIQSIQMNKFRQGLKPYVLRIKEGHLVGLAMDPLVGSPCSGCVELWLKTRGTYVEKGDLSEVKDKEIFSQLLFKSDPHTMVEVSHFGSPIEIKGLIFPHPECRCKQDNYVGSDIDKNTHFSFSPIVSMKSVRFGTPTKNLWLTEARGRSAFSNSSVVAFGGAEEKEQSRLKALEMWLKKATIFDGIVKRPGHEVIDFHSQKERLPLVDSNGIQTTGSSKTMDLALLDALYSQAVLRTVKQFSREGRNPMLVVGTNTWLRNRVPFFLLQLYDLYLLFYPNNSPTWVIGLHAQSRLRLDEKPIFVFSSHSSPMRAVEEGIYKVLEYCRPSGPEKMDSTLQNKANPKLNMWWTHWLYRCPKISLSEVLHLESYPTDSFEAWREYLKGEVTYQSMNHQLFPSQIRNIVSVSASDEKTMIRNVRGIGSSLFQHEPVLY